MTNTWRWYSVGLRNILQGNLHPASDCFKVMLVGCSFRGCQSHCIIGNITGANYRLASSNCYNCLGKKVTTSVVKNACWIEIRASADVCWKCMSGTAHGAVLYKSHGTAGCQSLLGFMQFNDVACGTKGCAVTATLGAFKIDMTDSNNAMLRIKYNG